MKDVETINGEIERARQLSPVTNAFHQGLERAFELLALWDGKGTPPQPPCEYKKGGSQDALFRAFVDGVMYAQAVRVEQLVMADIVGRIGGKKN